MILYDCWEVNESKVNHVIVILFWKPIKIRVITIIFLELFDDYRPKKHEALGSRTNHMFLYSNYFDN